MKIVWLGLGLLATSMWSMQVWGQHDVSSGQPSAAAESLSIDQQRQKFNSKFDAEEVVCQTKFVVTSCLHDVGARRIAMLAELKRQEAILNAVERRNRAAEQRKRGEEKAAERVNNDADRSGASSLSELDRKKAQDEKVLQHQKPETTPVGGEKTEKPATNAPAPDSAKSRAAYAQRLEDAKLRRSSRDKRLLERSTQSPALPVPP